MSRCEALIYENDIPFQCEKNAPHDGEKHVNMEIAIEWDMWINE